jgi:hypothetical protein
MLEDLRRIAAVKRRQRGGETTMRAIMSGRLKGKTAAS